jgi:Phage Tail Protein X
MPIYMGSRYDRAVVDFVSFYQGGDAAPVVFYSFSDIGRLTYSEYTWKDGDRLDQVAMKFFKDSSRWWLIPEYNPHITDLQSIPAGTVIKIPHV